MSEQDDEELIDSYVIAMPAYGVYKNYVLFSFLKLIKIRTPLRKMKH